MGNEVDGRGKRTEPKTGTAAVVGPTPRLAFSLLYKLCIKCAAETAADQLWNLDVQSPQNTKRLQSRLAMN